MHLRLYLNGNPIQIGKCIIHYTSLDSLIAHEWMESYQIWLKCQEVIYNMNFYITLTLRIQENYSDLFPQIFCSNFSKSQPNFGVIRSLGNQRMMFD